MKKIYKSKKVNAANSPPPLNINLKSTDNNNELAENIINTIREPLLVLDQDLKVVAASRSFYDVFKVNPEETLGTLLYDLGNRQWNIPKLKDLLETILPAKTSFDNYEVEHEFATIGNRIMLLNARQIKRTFGKEKIILLAIEDITERRLAENKLSDKNRLTSEYLNILLDNAHAPIIIWDSLMRIKRFNLEFEKLSGYKYAEVIDKKIGMLFPKNKIVSTLKLIRNNLEVVNKEVIEVDILTKDKGIRTVLWNSTNILDDSGKNIVATITQDITERKRTEETLSLLEARYRRLFESAKDGILIINAESGKIVDVNPFLLNLLGYSKETFIGKKIWHIEIFKNIITKKVEFLEFQQKEFIRFNDLPLKTADGRMISVELISNTYLVNDHKVMQFNIRDISERKSATAKLRAKEYLLSQSQQLGHIGSWSWDLSGPFKWSDETYRIFGVSQETFIPTPESLTSLLHPDDRPAMQHWLESIDPRKSRHNIDFRIILPNGSIKYINGRGNKLYDAKNKPTYMAGTVQDITEQKQAEEILRNSEKRYKAITNAIPDLVFRLNRQGVYLDFKADEKELHYQSDEIIGKLNRDITPPEFADLVDLQIHNTLETGKTQTFEYQLFVPGTGMRDYNARMVASGKDEVIVFSRDITLQRQMEREKEVLTYNLKERVKELTCLFSIASITETPNISLSVMLGRIIKTIPSGWQYPEICCARIVLDKKEYKTNNYKETRWKQSTDIKINDKKIGSVEVFYLEKRAEIDEGPFLKEERNLLNLITERLGHIAERKKNEEQITILAHSLRSINECVSITDLDDVIIFVNESFIKTYGYNEEELIGKKISLVRSSKNPPSIVKTILPATINKDWNGELWNKRKDGSEFQIYLSTTTVKDKSGKIIGLIGVATDITDRKKMEADLSTAAEIAKLGYWEYDVASGNFTFNDQYYRLIHGSSTEKQGGNIMSAEVFAKKLVYPDDAIMIGQSLQEAIESPDPDYLGIKESRVFRDNGDIANVTVQFKVLKDSSGKTYKVYGINQDITDIKIKEKELIDAKNKAEEMSRLKTSFLANMSHELRTPLIGILGFAEFLESELKDKDLIEMANTIKTSGQRLNTTINNILDISKIEAEKLQINIQEQDLIKYLGEQIKLFSAPAEGKGLSLNFETKEEKLIAFIDSEMFASIISYLLNNAIKFTQKGKVTLRVMKQENNAVIEVEDTGIGVSEDLQEIIFDPFRQASEGHSRKFEGTGLGLAIVKKYTSIMGGTITLNSKTGDPAAGITGGSTFTLKFPLNGHIAENSISTRWV